MIPNAVQRFRHEQTLQGSSHQNPARLLGSDVGDSLRERFDFLPRAEGGGIRRADQFSREDRVGRGDGLQISRTPILPSEQSQHCAAAGKTGRSAIGRSTAARSTETRASSAFSAEGSTFAAWAAKGSHAK